MRKIFYVLPVALVFSRLKVMSVFDLDVLQVRDKLHPYLLLEPKVPHEIIKGVGIGGGSAITPTSIYDTEKYDLYSSLR